MDLTEKTNNDAIVAQLARIAKALEAIAKQSDPKFTTDLEEKQALARGRKI